MRSEDGLILSTRLSSHKDEDRTRNEDSTRSEDGTGVRTAPGASSAARQAVAR